MNEKRISIHDNLKFLYRAVLVTFCFLFIVLIICLFIKFDFYVSAEGAVVNFIEAPVKSNAEGFILKALKSDGDQVSKNEKLVELKDMTAKVVDVFSPTGGQFFTIGGERMSNGNNVKINQTLAMVLREGTFFCAQVSEKDILDVREDAPCIIRVWALDRGAYHTLSARVYYVSEIPTSDQGKVFYQTFCRFNDENLVNSIVRSGMSGKAKISIGQYSLFDSKLGFRNRQSH